MRYFSATSLAVLTAAVALGSLVSGSASALSLSVPQVAHQTAIAIADTQGVVTHAYAHLREKPSTSSKLLGTLKKGTKVDIIEKVEGGKWAHVKANNLEGYVATNLLK
ncbi:MAG TPA: SH3 domain-containing protein [Dongiaceae bacterium]|nr:SH3 domain-containing protein [Dongiaceae bacterium]